MQRDEDSQQTPPQPKEKPKCRRCEREEAYRGDLCRRCDDDDSVSTILTCVMAACC